MVRC